jgi:streptogramin lyase
MASRFVRANSFRLMLMTILGGIACCALSIPSTAVAKSEKAPPIGVEAFSTHPTGERPYFVCPPASQGRSSCQSVVVPASAKPAIRAERKALGLAGNGVSPALEGSGVEGGFSPADLRSAYNVPETGGKGVTIAIVDAYGYLNAESNLKVYREHYGLPPCTSANGCFRKVNQKGEEKNYPPMNFFDSWDIESALDLDMASAMCPECKLMLIQADDNSNVNLGAAVNKAAELGATVISNSWGGSERSTETEEDTLYYGHSGVPLFFSSGDSAYRVLYPAASTNAVAVGGTSLTKSHDGRAWHESVWQGAGSGCSTFEKKPEWQTDKGCGNRMVADVSAVADPRTPVSMYVTQWGEEATGPGWILVGGTSVSAPVLAGVEARATEAERAKGAKLFWDQGAEGKLFDVAEGGNGPCYPEPTYFCAGRGGYDGPTGWGTPGATRPGPPVAATYGATSIGPTRETLKGIVNPNRVEGKNTSYYWQVGTTTSYWEEEVGRNSIAASTAPVEVSTTLAGLTWGQTYHYRFVALNSSGLSYGADHTFTVGRWSAQENPGTPSDQPLGVSCGSASDCVAIGRRVVPYERDEYQKELEEFEKGEVTQTGSRYAYGYEPYGEHWSGGEWTSTAPIVPHEVDDKIESSLSDINCTSATFCLAVGRNFAERKEGEDGSIPLIETWNGKEWSLVPAAIPSDIYVEGKFKEVHLQGLDCASSSYCVAVGWYRAKVGGGPENKNLTETWNGTSWQVKETGGVFGSLSNDLSCPSTNWCMAVETTGQFPAITGYTFIWNGTKWSLQQERTGLLEEDVSCVSSTSCAVAAFYPGGKEAEDRGTMRTWNGSEWKEQEVKGKVSGVSCLSSRWCEAVGYTGGYLKNYFTEEYAPYIASALRWNGSSWVEEKPVDATQPSSAGESEFFGIDCNGSSCSAFGAYTAPRGILPLTEKLSLAPENLTAPTTSSMTPYQSMPISTSDGTWAGETGTMTYQWQRCSSQGKECANITGAVAASYTPTGTDVGHALIAQVTASGPGGGSSVSVVTKATGAVAPTGQVSAYTIAKEADPEGIAPGPDGNLWFVESRASKIGKMNVAGSVIAEYALPSGSWPNAVAAGPDGKLWFSEWGTSKIGKISTSGAVTEYALPANSKPADIAAGPDGKMWFADWESKKIGKITTSGGITEYSVPGSPAAIGSNGNEGTLWFSDGLLKNSKVGKITTSGVTTEYTMPAEEAAGSITIGPDGNMWCTLSARDRLCKVTPSGVVTEYQLPTNSGPEDIAVGPDGNLWFTESGIHDKIGKITPTGTITEFAVPVGVEGMMGIVEGSDHRMWFTAAAGTFGSAWIGAIVP